LRRYITAFVGAVYWSLVTAEQVVVLRPQPIFEITAAAVKMVVAGISVMWEGWGRADIACHVCVCVCVCVCVFKMISQHTIASLKNRTYKGDIACHVIRRTLKSRVLSYMICCDVTSKICVALRGGISGERQWRRRGKICSPWQAGAGCPFETHVESAWNLALETIT
jgi:hypothetical protein